MEQQGPGRQGQQKGLLVASSQVWLHALSVPVKVSIRVSPLLDLLMGVSLQFWLALAVSDDTLQGLPGATTPEPLPERGSGGWGGAPGQALRKEGWLAALALCLACMPVSAVPCGPAQMLPVHLLKK